jgi:hypothetical protein
MEWDIQQQQRWQSAIQHKVQHNQQLTHHLQRWLVEVDILQVPAMSQLPPLPPPLLLLLRLPVD